MARLVLMAVIQSVLVLWLAHTISSLFAQFSTMPPISRMIGVMMQLLIAVLGIALAKYGERVIAERFAQRFIADTRRKVFAHFYQLTPSRAIQTGRGGLLLRFTGDLGALRNWITQGIPRLFVATAFFSTSLAVLLGLNWRIAVTMAFIALLGTVLSWKLGTGLRVCVRRARRRRARLVSSIAEKASEIPVIQSFGRMNREVNRLRRQNEQLSESMISTARTIGGMRATNEIMTGCLLLCLLMLGVHEVTQQRLDVHDLVAALGYMLFALPPLRGLGRVNEYWHQASVSYRKLDRFLSISPQPDGQRGLARPLQQTGPDIHFSGVGVKGRLFDLSQSIAANSKVAIVGPNGAGKSTCLRLLLRMMEPSSGKIRFAGIPLSQIQLNSLRLRVAMVSQELPLLKGSLRRNLQYGLSRQPDETILSLCHRYGLEGWLHTLPKGLDTHIEERGRNLSAGESQRLLLLRALLREPRLLLVDELESGLDPASRQQIREVLLGFEHTLILVTHDPYFADLADEIWLMKEGRVVEAGPPDILMHGFTATAQFFARQATNSTEEASHVRIGSPR